MAAVEEPIEIEDREIGADDRREEEENKDQTKW